MSNLELVLFVVVLKFALAGLILLAAAGWYFVELKAKTKLENEGE